MCALAYSSGMIVAPGSNRIAARSNRLGLLKGTFPPRSAVAFLKNAVGEKPTGYTAPDQHGATETLSRRHLRNTDEVGRCAQPAFGIAHPPAFAQGF